MPEFKAVPVPQRAWHGDTEVELRFPSSWDVHPCYMRGHDSPRLSEEGMREAFRHPIGMDPISKLARGSKQVAILFDDMSRPTPVAQIVPYLLAELKEAGVPDENIRFIAALGAHGTLNGLQLRKKLGDAVLERFPVYNHNPYENCTFVGKTSQGTPVSINSEVMACDLKIGIGCIIPHPVTGFGGGGKIILPGVAAMETIVANHGQLMQQARQLNRTSQIGLGLFEENLIRLDIAEAARMIAPVIKIDTILNTRREITAIFVGELETVFAEGVKVAREAYATERIAGVEVVIANVNAKPNETLLAIPSGVRLLGEAGGDLVIISSCPEGEVPHYLLRSFGAKMGGKLWRPYSHLPRKVNRLILFAPYIDKAGVDWIGPPQYIIRANSWDDVIEQLKAAHPGGARVAVIPDATMQYFPV